MHDNISTALITAFEQHYDTRWDDAQLRNERLAWRAAWDAAGAAPVTPQGEWRIDTSAGREILVYKGCSVIEEADARYVLSLIAAASQPAAVAGPADELAELAMLNKLIELGAKASYAHAKSNSDDGPAGTAAYVQWQELRAEMGELIRAHVAPALEAPAAPALAAEFTDQSIADPVEKARRYLKAMADEAPNSVYFFDDGYPRRASSQDAKAALVVLEQLAARAPAPQAPAAPAVDAALNALIADVRALPTLRASEIDGEESDGTPKHWRNRPFVSLRKLELLLRDRVTASSDTALLNFIAAEYLDLRSFGMPTGQGDADVGWRVIQHHMGEPNERVVAEVYKDDPRSAIRAAIARMERDPYCTGALHEEDAAQAAAKGAP